MRIGGRAFVRTSGVIAGSGENEVQYRNTQARLREFEAARDRLMTHPDPPAVELERDTLDGLAAGLREQLAEYDGLRNGTIRLPENVPLADLPDLLIRGRIAAGLSPH